MIYEGTATKEVIIVYFKYILPKLPPKSMVILDNASVHKSKELKELFRLVKRTLRNYFDYSLNLFENLCNCLNGITGELKSTIVF